MRCLRLPALPALAFLALLVPQDGAGQVSPDSAAVSNVVAAFHEALASGDGERALSLLTDRARVLEGGGVETRDEYADHHLPADMAFAQAVTRERGDVEIVVRGDVAWAVSTSRAVGTWRERSIDSRTAELVVLERRPQGWRISAIHWSSR